MDFLISGEEQLCHLMDNWKHNFGIFTPKICHLDYIVLCWSWSFSPRLYIVLCRTLSVNFGVSTSNYGYFSHFINGNSSINCKEQNFDFIPVFKSFTLLMTPLQMRLNSRPDTKLWRVCRHVDAKNGPMHLRIDPKLISIQSGWLTFHSGPKHVAEIQRAAWIFSKKCIKSDSLLVKIQPFSLLQCTIFRFVFSNNVWPSVIWVHYYYLTSANDL